DGPKVDVSNGRIKGFTLLQWSSCSEQLQPELQLEAPPLNCHLNDEDLPLNLIYESRCCLENSSLMPGERKQLTMEEDVISWSQINGRWIRKERENNVYKHKRNEVISCI
ncbi:hypothetical protein V2J09_007529, partial [Rumex salicifolius]